MNWRRFFTKRKIVIYITILAIAGFALSRIFGNNGAENIITDTVKQQDLQRTVLATGKVVSDTDLDLSFKTSGRVNAVFAKVGAKAAAGQILATLDQGSELAALKTAQGALASAQANYQKVLEGTRTEEVAVAEAAVNAAVIARDNAEQNLGQTNQKQEVLVNNAYRALLNTSLSARAASIYDTAVTLTVTGTYAGHLEGDYLIKLVSTGNVSFYYQVSGIENYSGLLERGKPLPLGNLGLYITFGTAGTLSLLDTWVVEIPNKQSANYITNYNAYQSALQTESSALSEADAALSEAEAVVAQKEADLELKKTPARPSEIAAARASVLSAEGQVSSAQAALENTMIRTPVAGTVTRVDIKPGEQATAGSSAIILQDVDNLYLEVNISEANIAGIKTGQNVTVTFDALGADKIYNGQVQFIDPASTLVSGVVNYQIKVSLPRTPEILPGMTANLIVVSDQKEDVLVIPVRAVVDREGKKFVRVVTDPLTKTFFEEEVELGMEGDGGLVEVTSGLISDQVIVTSIVLP